MTRQRLTLTCLAALPVLLAGCGDDLESRNAAIESAGGQGGEPEMVLTPGRQGEDRRNAEEASRGNGGFGRPGRANARDEEDDDELVVDAEPDDLIDAAEGFDPSPIDDASGIAADPLPEDDWGE